MKCVKCGKEITTNSLFTRETLEKLQEDGQVTINELTYEYDSNVNEVTFICPFCNEQNMKTGQEFIEELSASQSSNNQVYSQQQTMGNKKTDSIDIPDPTLLSISIMKIEKYKSSLESFARSINGLADTLNGLDIDVSGIDIIGAGVSSLLNGDSDVTVVLKQLNDTKKILDDKMYKGNFDLFAAVGIINLIGNDPSNNNLYGMNLSDEEKLELFHNMRSNIERNKEKYTLSSNSKNGEGTSELYGKVINTLFAYEAALLTSSDNLALSNDDGEEVRNLTQEDYFNNVEQCEATEKNLVAQYKVALDEYNKVAGKLAHKWDREHPAFSTKEKYIEEQFLNNEEYKLLAEKLTGLCESIQLIRQIKQYNLEHAFNMFMEEKDFINNSLIPSIARVELEYKLETGKGIESNSGAETINTWEEGDYKCYDANGNLVNLTSLQLAKYCYDNGIELPKKTFFHQSTFVNQEYETKEYLSEIIPYISNDETKILMYLEQTNNDRYNQYFKYLKNKAIENHGMEEAQKVIDKIDGFYKNIGNDLGIDSVTGEYIIYSSLDADLDTLFLLQNVGLKDGLGQFASGLKNFFELDGAITVEQYKTQLILESLKAQYGAKKLMNLFSTGVYEISTSIGNMSPSTLIAMIPGFQFAGLGLMGMSAAGNTVRKGLQMDMSLEAAWVYGLLNGASEAGLQYLLGGINPLSKGEGSFAEGISKLLHIPNFFADMLAEGTEESLQAILEPLFATISSCGKIPFQVSSEDILKSGIYGMITAGIMNGGQIVINSTAYTITNEMIPDLIVKFKGCDMTRTEAINELSEQLTEFNDDELTWEDEIILDENASINIKFLADMIMLFENIEDGVNVVTTQIVKKLASFLYVDTVEIESKIRDATTDKGLLETGAVAYQMTSKDGKHICVYNSDFFKFDSAASIYEFIHTVTHETVHALTNKGNAISGFVITPKMVAEYEAKGYKFKMPKGYEAYGFGITEGMTELVARMADGSAGRFEYGSDYGPLADGISKLHYAGMLDFNKAFECFTNKQTNLFNLIAELSLNVGEDTAQEILFEFDNYLYEYNAAVNSEELSLEEISSEIRKIGDEFNRKMNAWVTAYIGGQ